MSEPQVSSRSRVYLRVAVVIAVFVVGITVLRSPLVEMMDLEELRVALTDLRQTARASWYAPFIFVLSYVVGATFFVPATLFILTAAFLWGWVIGGFYALLGAILCAGLSFELSRYVFGELAERLFSKRLPWLHRMLDGAGIRSVMVMRLVPGIPFPVFNFGAGLTSLRSRDYMIGSALGLMIPTFIVAFSADAILAGTLDRGAMAGRLVLAAILLAILAFVPPLIARRIRGRSISTDPLPTDREQPSSMVN